jgi:hypothetical protein
VRAPRGPGTVKPAVDRFDGPQAGFIDGIRRALDAVPD